MNEFSISEVINSAWTAIFVPFWTLKNTLETKTKWRICHSSWKMKSTLVKLFSFVSSFFIFPATDSSRQSRSPTGEVRQKASTRVKSSCWSNTGSVWHSFRKDNVHLWLLWRSRTIGWRFLWVHWERQDGLLREAARCWSREYWNGRWDLFEISFSFNHKTFAKFREIYT